MEELAGKYSTDQGSAKMGGDLGYQDPSKYVPEFGAFCKQGKAGETNIVKTQYGFHIIRITGPMDYTKIKFFQNEIEISAGQKTVKVVDEKSRNFKNSVKNDFDKAVEKGGIVPRVLKDFTTDQKTIVGVDAAAGRHLVQHRHSLAGGKALASLASAGLCRCLVVGAAFLLDARRQKRLHGSLGVCRHPRRLDGLARVVVATSKISKSQYNYNK
jgi:hypothetical protein